MTRSQAKDFKRRVNQKVLIPEPVITSPAALALLTKKYYVLDTNIPTNSKISRLRGKWLKEQLKSPDEKGGLTCAICGKKGLLPHTPYRKNKATLDHIFEIGRGGSWNDPSNFQVACYHCNSFKNTKLQRKH